jgi:hypothetical protein
MTKPEELELFEFLGRQTKLREWLAAQIGNDVKVLMQALDVDQLRKAQGRAQFAQSMLSLMDAAKK